MCKKVRVQLDLSPEAIWFSQNDVRHNNKHGTTSVRVTLTQQQCISERASSANRNISGRRLLAERKGDEKRRGKDGQCIRKGEQRRNSKSGDFSFSFNCFSSSFFSSWSSVWPLLSVVRSPLPSQPAVNHLKTPWKDAANWPERAFRLHGQTLPFQGPVALYSTCTAFDLYAVRLASSQNRHAEKWKRARPAGHSLSGEIWSHLTIFSSGSSLLNVKIFLFPLFCIVAITFSRPHNKWIESDNAWPWHWCEVFLFF